LQGRISTDTFEARIEFAYQTRSGSALQELLSDLPVWAALEGLGSRVENLGARVLRLLADDNVHEPHRACSTVLLSRCTPQRLIVGRSTECDIVLAAEAVSRRHALISHGRDGWRVADLDSTNGTYVDGRRVDLAPLIAGTRLQVADVLLNIA